MKYKVAVAQFQPKLMDREANLIKIKSLIENVEADLVVLPELATSGYVFTSKEQVAQIAEDAQTGATTELLKKLAAKNNTSYVIGFPELAEGKFYNSSILVNPDGEVFVYRKTHLFYEEKLWFEPGDSGFNVFPAKDGVKVGMMICFDWIFPESARSLALNGAQIIAHPTNLVLPWCQQAMITRSLENRVFSITSNRTGLEGEGEKELNFTGMSQILGNKGEILHRMNETEESVIVVEIDPELAKDKTVTPFNDAILDRRTYLYKS